MFFKGINHYGNKGLFLDFGSESSQEISKEVNAMFDFILKLDIPLLNATPSFNKIVLHFKTQENREQSIGFLEKQLNHFQPSYNSQSQKKWIIPACYEDSYALDLERIQQIHDLGKNEIINLHTSIEYYTYYIGFMPGFPYLGDIPSPLITPRLDSPRVQIPAGSVGIAKKNTCIYPKVSPGGWNIIAQVPFEIFNLNHSRTSLFLPGDKVQFQSISSAEFEKIQNQYLTLDDLIQEYSQ